MKNKTTSLRILGLLALLCASLAITACPRGVRPPVPHPHRLPRPVLPMDAMPQMERHIHAIILSILIAQPATDTKV